MKAEPPARLVALYQRAQICQWFPAYTLEAAGELPADEIFTAIQLLTVARQVQSNG